LTTSQAFPENKSFQLLIVNIVNEVIDPVDFNLLRKEQIDNVISFILEKVYGNTRVFEIEDYPTLKTNNANGMIQVALDKSYSEAASDKLIVTIVLRCYGNVDEWRRSGEYPQDALSLFNQAAYEVNYIVSDFRQHFPQSKVVGFASTIGSKVLLRSIEKGADLFNTIILYEPPQDEFARLQPAVLSNYPNTNFYAFAHTGETSEFPAIVDDEIVKEIVDKW